MIKKVLLVLFIATSCFGAKYHQDAKDGEIHTPFRWIWADSAARVAQSTVKRDTTKLGFQRSDFSVWYLYDTLPTWYRVGTYKSDSLRIGGILIKNNDITGVDSLNLRTLVGDSATIPVFKGVKTIRDSTYFSGGIRGVRLTMDSVKTTALRVGRNIQVDSNMSIGGVAPVSNGANYNNLRIKNATIMSSTYADFSLTSNSYHDGTKWVPFSTYGSSKLAMLRDGILTFDNAPSHATEHTFVERMRIAADGKVGIGTASPGEIVHMYVNTNSLRMSIFENANTGSSAQACFTARCDGGDAQFGKTSTVSTYAGAAYVWNSANTALMFATNNTECFRVSADGKVGIGTSSPSELLHVKGKIKTDSSVITPSITINGGTALTRFVKGTFACSLFDNITYRAVVTAKYTVIDSVVTVYIPAITGTGTGSAIYLRTFPTAIRPASIHGVPFIVFNAGGLTNGCAQIFSTGVVLLTLVTGVPLGSGTVGIQTNYEADLKYTSY